MVRYIPKRGDIVWLEFNPWIGHEQSGVRPALIISEEIYNKKTGLCLAMPITSKIKGYPFEVILKTKNIQGVILSDQIKSLDFKSRKIKFCDKIDKETFENALDKLSLLLFEDK